MQLFGQLLEFEPMTTVFAAVSQAIETCLSSTPHPHPILGLMKGVTTVSLRGIVKV